MAETKTYINYTVQSLFIKSCHYRQLYFLTAELAVLGLNVSNKVWGMP